VPAASARADDEANCNSICENDRHGMDSVHLRPAIDMPAAFAFA